MDRALFMMIQVKQYRQVWSTIPEANCSLPLIVKKFIGWLFPPFSWVKVNTDGITKGSPGQVGSEGVARDASGS